MMWVDEALPECRTAVIVEARDPEQGILFRSRALDNARVDSDTIDLVIVEAEPFGPAGVAVLKRRAFGASSHNFMVRRIFRSTAGTRRSAGAATPITCSRVPRAKAGCPVTGLDRARVPPGAADAEAG